MKLIRGQNGQTIGFTVEAGDRVQTFDRSGALVAWYNKRQDKTFKRDASMAGFGDQAVRFLKEK
jgi:hypothetical protein